MRARGGFARALLAARPAPDREGHPAVPLRVLAGAAPLRRLRGAAPDLRPRVPRARRAQDLEVTGERDRSARPRRRLRVDAVRYWATRSVQFGQDGSVSLDSLHERYERELGNDLGNLVVENDRNDRQIPRRADSSRPGAEGAPSLDALGQQVEKRLDDFDLTGAIDAIWDVVRALNKFVTDSKPWELAKDDANAEELDQRALRARRRHPRRRRRVARVSAGDDAAHPPRTRPARGLRVDPSRRARPSRRRTSNRRRRSFPASRRRPPLRDRHARAPPCVRGRRAELVDRARQAGVDRIIEVGAWPTESAPGTRHRRARRRRFPVRSASTRTMQGRRRARAARGRFASSMRSRWAKRASTTTATTRRTMRSASSSRRTSRSPRSSESRSSSTCEPPMTTRRARSAASTAPSSSTASRPRGCSGPRSSAGTTSPSPGT